MSDVTVKQLAEQVGAPVERLLKQMQEQMAKQAGSLFPGLPGLPGLPGNKR